MERKGKERKGRERKVRKGKDRRAKEQKGKGGEGNQRTGKERAAVNMKHSRHFCSFPYIADRMTAWLARPLRDLLFRLTTLHRVLL